MTQVRVKFNVGGTSFETTKSTIEHCAVLKTLIKYNEQNEQVEVPFLDRDPEGFRHVLGLLRDPQYPFPYHYRYELNYYGLKAELMPGEDPMLKGFELLANKLDRVGRMIANNLSYRGKETKCSNINCMNEENCTLDSRLFCNYCVAVELTLINEHNHKSNFVRDEIVKSKNSGVYYAIEAFAGATDTVYVIKCNMEKEKYSFGSFSKVTTEELLLIQTRLNS